MWKIAIYSQWEKDNRFALHTQGAHEEYPAANGETRCPRGEAKGIKEKREEEIHDF